MGGTIRKLLAALGSSSISLALVALVFAGCGGGSSTTYTVTVTVSPTSATVSLGGSQQFQVITSGAANTAVTWEVNGAAGGNATYGTITTAGLYKAPAAFPSPNTVTVTAISQANTADLANVSITLVSGVTVSVSPASVNMQLGQTQQFTATVTGSSNTSVTWQAGGVNGGNSSVGTISSSGLYTAPASATTPLAVSVTAVSEVDASKSATVSITIHGSIIVAVTPNPATIQTFHSQQFVAQVSGASSPGVTWQVNGVTGGNTSVGIISTDGIYTAPSVVPTAASSTTRKTTAVSVTAISQQDSTATGSAVVTVVSANQAQQKIPVFLGTSGGSIRDTGTGSSCCGGTLGALVSRGGQKYILSTNHVLARLDNGAAGDSIIQPGLIDSSCSTTGTTTVATLSQFANLESPASGEPVVDAALAAVTSGTVDSSGTILGLGATLNSLGASTDAPPLGGSGKLPAISDNVVKSGRSTGVTCSSVSVINLTASVEYTKECGAGSTFTVTFDDLVEISGAGFGADGDSGSLVVEQSDATPVGLLIGSSDSDTIASPIGDVLAALADPNTAEKPVIVGSSSPHAVAVSCPTLSSNITSTSGALARTVSSANLAGAYAALEPHSARLLALPSIKSVGVGASLDEPGQPAILLFVARDAPRNDLPTQVEGIRTRFLEIDSSPSRKILSAAETSAIVLSSRGSSQTSSLSAAEISRATSILRGHREGLMRIAGVQAVGVTSSSDSPGDSAILIHFIRGVSHGQAPVEIDGVRTRLRESTRFQASSHTRGGAAACFLLPTSERLRVTARRDRLP
jgi:hypothetical protein